MSLMADADGGGKLTFLISAQLLGRVSSERQKRVCSRETR